MKSIKESITIFAIFRTQPALEYAIERLKMNGFMSSNISVLMPSTLQEHAVVHENSTKLPEFATGGAAGGAVVGGILGWLAGIGLIAIPGLGPFIAAGPIVGGLSGLGIGGAIGGVSGALIGVGVPEYEAKQYEDKIQSGGILLSIHTTDRGTETRALEILNECGGTDISSKRQPEVVLKNLKPRARSPKSQKAVKVPSLRSDETSYRY